MEQTLTLQQLIERLMNLEREVNSLHRDLAHFQHHPDASTVTLTYRWADKNIQRRWMSQVFASYSIQGKPRGALALQQALLSTGDDLILCASDKRLLRAAQAENLKVFDPEIDTKEHLQQLVTGE